MNRRSFLGLIPAALATATLDPERLLWRLGAKRISIPKPQSGVEDVLDLATFQRQYFQIPLSGFYFIGHRGPWI